jgi:hypothetical protein
MAELEIHHEVEGGHDPLGQRVGVLAAVLAVFLAVVTILSHRTHTDAILLKAGANDDWQHYQAVRVKFHNLEVGADLIGVLAGKDQSAALLADYDKGKAKYDAQAKEIQQSANQKEKEAARAEDRALRYDLGEGLLEIGLVLSSLYFIARRTLFPIAGIVAGIAGVLVAAAGLLV